MKKLSVFNILVLSQALSLLGTALTNFAIGVWAYQKAGNVTDFTWIAIAGALPGLLFTPIAGTLADRWSRRKILLFGQIGSMFCTLALVSLFLNNELEIYRIFIIVSISSIFAAFMVPAFSASVPLLVDKEKLGQANGTVTLFFGMAQMLGPGLSGFAIDQYGINAVFIFDFLTFLIGIFVLSVIKIPSPKPGDHIEEEKGSMLGEMQFAWNYMRNKKGLMGVVGINAMLFLNVGAMQVLILPMVLGFATRTDLGLIQSIGGIGVIIGGSIMMSWGGPKKKVVGSFLGCAVVGLVLVFLPMFKSVAILAIGSVIMMSAIPIASANTQVIWQRKVAPEVQARVFAFRNAISNAMVPVGYLISGRLADQVFEPNLAVGGAWADSLGLIYGVGDGRGAAAMITMFGLISLLVLIASWLNPNIREIEDRLPEYPLAQDDPIEGAAVKDKTDANTEGVATA